MGKVSKNSVCGNIGLGCSVFVNKIRENGYKINLFRARSERDFTDWSAIELFSEKDIPSMFFLLV